MNLCTCRSSNFWEANADIFSIDYVTLLGALEGTFEGARDGLRSERGTAETAKFWADDDGRGVGGLAGDFVGRLVGLLVGDAVGGSDGTSILANFNMKFLNFL